ncbi:MAG: undecaprenyl/decaprenyl-phosphate alpha-N-acetylglucosaminyl 1-phosphate transferase [Bifidobacteriaceae bacterium]|nr:undecaprenyl/decaprenyl-phosphate alpha-N-acetylglucosaminyl 1-phosphate transferase [Bifidobacteriaceae bacterium]
MRTYLLLAVIAAVVTAVSVPLVRRFAVASGAITPVRARDVHTAPTPRLGGLAMYLGVAAALAVASQTEFLRPVFTESSSVWGILGAAAFVCLLGAFDDWWDLSWVTKLAGQILAAGFLAWNHVQLITFPVAGITIVSSRLSLFLTILVVVAAINAINFIDGLDGLAAGVVAIGCTAFFGYSYLISRQSGSSTYATLAALILAITVGVCAGFLPYNFHPAKIFMGDSGTMLLGLLFAAATIAVTGQTDPAASVVSQTQAIGAVLPIVLPFFVLALPLLDMLMAVARRMRAGQSPFKADRMHLHHRLLRAGHGQRRAALVMYAWTAILAFGAAGLAAFRLGHVLIFVAVGSLVAILLTTAPVTRALRRRSQGRHRAKAPALGEAAQLAADAVPSAPDPAAGAGPPAAPGSAPAAPPPPTEGDPHGQ